MRVVPVEDLLEDVLASLRPALAGRRVVMRIAPEVSDAFADSACAGNALRDLAVTAASAALPGAELRVSAVVWQSSVEIRIAGAEGSLAGGSSPGGPGLQRARAAIRPLGGEAWVEASPGGGATLGLRFKAASA